MTLCLFAALVSWVTPVKLGASFELGAAASKIKAEESILALDQGCFDDFVSLTGQTVPDRIKPEHTALCSSTHTLHNHRPHCMLLQSIML